MGLGLGLWLELGFVFWLGLELGLQLGLVFGLGLVLRFRVSGDG